MIRLSEVNSVRGVVLATVIFVIGSVPGFAATIDVGGSCSLVDAITSANSNVSVNTCTAGDLAGTDVLRLSGTSTVLSSVNNTTFGANGLPAITSAIEIEGTDANTHTISQDIMSAPLRFFYVSASGSLTLKNIALRGGSLPATGSDLEQSGGAILNQGTVVLNSVYLAYNTASYGGVIYNAATASLSVYDGTLSGNSARVRGGAIYNDGSASLRLSRLSANSTDGDGAGVYNSGQLEVINSSLEDNVSQNHGGGFYQSAGELNLRSSTVYRNRASLSGSGFYVSAGAVSLSNSTISANNGSIQANAMLISGGTMEIVNSTISDHSGAEPGEANIQNNGASISLVNSIIADTSGKACMGVITDLGNNWFQDDSCGRSGDGDPQLGILADNGGPSADGDSVTRTQALLPGSGAIDAGNDAICAQSPINNLDQRGYTRPQALHCDIGAYEVAVHSDTIIVDGINCSLVNAIHSANLNQPVGGCTAGVDSGTDTLVLQQDTLYELSAVDNGTLQADGLNGLPVITSAIRIQGNGAQIRRAAGAPAFRLFLVDTPANLQLINLSISNGRTNDTWDESGRGGAIYNFGTLSLDNCKLYDNQAYAGGAIANELGSVSMINSSLYSNQASPSNDGGGGLYSEAGTVRIDRSTVALNNAYYGGGVYVFSGTDLSVINSTVSGNTAAETGGGLYIDSGSGTQIRNSTISSNVASLGGGLHADASDLIVSNSLIANHASSSDCSFYPGGSFTEQGTNWFEDDSCNGLASGDPVTGPLADNGGTGKTHALLAGSGAIDAADDALCAATPVNNIDQRGETRPKGEHCDLGAFETDASGLSLPPVDSSFFVLPLSNGKVVIFGL